MSPELLRQLWDQSVSQVEGAVYWVDKVVSLYTEEHPEDVYSLVSVKQCYRAATIMRNNLHKSHVAARVRFRPLAYNHHFVYI